jgi:hypothetical protein
LAKIPVTWLDRALGDEQPAREAAVALALRHAGEDLALARRERVQRAGAVSSAEDLAQHLRVQRRTAVGHLADRAGEAIDVADTLSEQDARARRIVLDPRSRLSGGGALRDQQQPDLRQLRADRAQPFLRHVDADHRDVRTVAAELALQLLAVGGVADDVEARFLEQMQHPRAAERRRLGEHDAHQDARAR